MTKQIAETTDGQFMVLVNGLQWGTKRDRSGASTQTWPTREAAQKAYRNAQNRARYDAMRSLGLKRTSYGNWE